MPQVNNVQTVHLSDTVASRSYPFTQLTLDQIRDLREQAQDELQTDTGLIHMVPAPVILAEAVNELWKERFQS